MKRCAALLAATVLLLAAFPLSAAETPVEAFLPATCAPGWVMDGSAATYTRDNLYKYIDGEAELYMPYGLERAATVMYVRQGNKESGLVVNIFKMGSLLDAFGIYANYRSPSLERAKVGGEGFVEESQLMFYQDRYFVQVMSSGSMTREAPLFVACATSVARNLPGGSAEPRELLLMKVPGLVPGTEKYFPEGLLGYGFLGRGFTAEVMLKGERVKAVLVMGRSKEGTERAFDGYVKYLTDSKAAHQVAAAGVGRRLHGTDPLFKGVVLQQAGPYAIGLTGLKTPRDGDGLIEEWQRALSMK